MRLSLPAQPQFARSTRLWVFFSLLGVSLDDAQRPGLGLSFGLKSGDTLSHFLPAQVQASRGSVPHSYTVLAAFDLQALQPGKYTLCFAERNDGPFPTLTERHGLGKDTSAITVMGISGTAEVLPGDGEGATPEAILSPIVAGMRAAIVMSGISRKNAGQRMFGELIAHEQHRKTLREQGIGEL